MAAVILFDGVCDFCNGAVNFVIGRDKAEYFKFAALQSDLGSQLRSKYAIDEIETDSVILIENGIAYLRSTAALRIARHLDGIWSWSYVFIVVPRRIRDWAYNLFAKYRYKLFGRQETCLIPTPDVRARFLQTEPRVPEHPVAHP